MRLKLYAYFAGNLGDDLMVRLLLERYPNIRFFTDSWAEESNIFRKYPNFENMEALQERHGRLNHLLNLLTGYAREDFYIRRIRKRREESCRGAVYIGGSVYTQRTPAAREAEKLRHGPLFVVGANFAGDPAEFRDYFRRCAGVTFRDRVYYEAFRTLETVGYSPDVVLNWKGKPELCDGRTLISVMDFRARAELLPWAEDYENLIAALCRKCENPVLVSFCKKEGDEAALARILARIGPETQVERLCYRGDMEPVLDAFSRAERVIATRMHAMVLAWCYRKPVFAVSYDPKIRNVAQDMEFPGFCELSDLHQMTADRVLKGCCLPENLEEKGKAAARQFAQLDGFLEGKHG